MKKVLYLLLLFSRMNCIGQITCCNLEKIDTHLLNKVSNKYPNVCITDYAISDFDEDGKSDYVINLVTNQLIKPTNMNYRDPLLIYMSKKDSLIVFNRLKPCYNCGQISILSNGRKYFSLNHAAIDHAANFHKHESYYFFYVDSLQTFILTQKAIFSEGASETGDITSSCQYEYVSLNIKKKIQNIDLMRDLFTNKKKWWDNITQLEEDDCEPKTIKISKATIYSSPTIVTKMYLVEGNKINIIENKGSWLKIRYYGENNIVEGWIKKSDVEMK